MHLFPISCYYLFMIYYNIANGGRNMRSCWIIYNGSLQSEKFLDQAHLVADAAARAGIQPILLKNYELMMNLEESISHPPDGFDC